MSLFNVSKAKLIAIFFVSVLIFIVFWILNLYVFKKHDRFYIREYEEPAQKADLGGRKFHIINLSLSKTGSTSIYGIFSRLNSSHEFMNSETTETLFQWQEGKIDTVKLDKFLLDRDQKNKFQVDSSTFLHLAQDRLFYLFPQAKFLLCVRDGQSWITSL